MSEHLLCGDVSVLNCIIWEGIELEPRFANATWKYGRKKMRKFMWQFLFLDLFDDINSNKETKNEWNLFNEPSYEIRIERNRFYIILTSHEQSKWALLNRSHGVGEFVLSLSSILIRIQKWPIKYSYFSLIKRVDSSRVVIAPNREHVAIIIISEWWS